jgi:hypothetical protein
MDAHSLLMAHVQRAHDELVVAQKSLGLARFPERQRMAVQERFDSRFHRHTADIDAIVASLDAGGSPAEAWKHLRSTLAAADTTVRESLAFLEGMLIRAENLDQGMCRLADELLNELTRKTRSSVPWSKVTILDEGESLHHEADIIRIRYPAFSPWSLPLVAHEFGHLVSRDLSLITPDGTDHMYPFKAVLAKEVKRSAIIDEALIREFFSDFFAVYSLGPSFACAAILVLFDPVDANEGDGRHPPPTDRVAFILQTLRRLGTQFGGIADQLGTAWLAMVGDVEGKPSLPGKSRVSEALFDDFWQLVATHLPECRYTGWSRALELSAAWHAGARVSDGLLEISDIADVLNSAWFSRLHRWTEFDEVQDSIESWTSTLWRELIQTRWPDGS